MHPLEALLSQFLRCHRAVFLHFMVAYIRDYQVLATTSTNLTVKEDKALSQGTQAPRLYGEAKYVSSIQ